MRKIEEEKKEIVEEVAIFLQLSEKRVRLRGYHYPLMCLAIGISSGAGGAGSL